MPLEITFTLSDEDLDRFQAIVDKAREAVESQKTAEQIETAARELREVRIAGPASGNARAPR